MSHGYTVLAIPENGLFVRHGRLETDDGTPINPGELVLFARREDADRDAEGHARSWKFKGVNWNFQVIPVVVKEKL